VQTRELLDAVSGFKVDAERGSSPSSAWAA